MTQKEIIPLDKKIEKDMELICIFSHDVSDTDSEKFIGATERLENDVKENIQGFLKVLIRTAIENDWEVSIDDNYEDGFRVIDGRNFINDLSKLYFGGLAK
jgi:formylmethanofuran dehydrogenase subunit C